MRTRTNPRWRLQWPAAAAALLAATPHWAPAQNLDSILPLVVMVQAKAGEADRIGAGIILGVRSDRLYIATANHVARAGARPADQIRVQFQWLPGEWTPATLLDKSDSALDLAVLAAPGVSRLAVPDIRWAVLAPIESLTPGAKVFPIGNPGGEAWFVPKQPHVVSKTGSQTIHTEGRLAPGHSGGALVTEQGALAGLLSEVGDVTCASYRFDRIIERIREWGLPVQLEPAKAAPAPSAGKARPPPQSPSPLQGKRVTGTILFNGRPVSGFTPAQAVIELMEMGSRQLAPVEQTYDSRTARFVLGNVPPGKYLAFVRVESGYPFDAESGGDYSSRISGLNPEIVVAPHSTDINQDLSVVQVIRLTKPVDNQNRRTSVSDPPETLYQTFYAPSAQLFEWEPVPGAAFYSVTFLLQDRQGGPYLDRINERIAATRYSPALRVTSGGAFYSFSVEAFSAANQLIGHFQNYYKDGSGGWFTFRVLSRP